ncbi:uncharacterized membrane protein HdeD (DUF308 family) [Methanolinea mesophila]|uniref:DUF308 domain-containing protein n=1 Tax=Methanolinea mesophila TaxID=547055 RepID=UPI001AE1BCC6|nr:DUF308 domain-containing protein [Methanolinea mesophila]MBP1929815.1 uncharacterized membrane protein HdeD (DUF308 family) [Methanolinea mesophila]
MVSYCHLCTTRSWKTPLALGMCGIILGGLLFLFPSQALRVLIYLTGAIAVLIGIVLLFIAWTISRSGSPFALIPLLIGLLVIILGVFALLYPNVAGTFIAVIIAALCIIAGLGGAFTGGIQNGPILRRIAITVGGIALAALGVAILLYPDLTTAGIVKILGIFIFIAGIVSLAGSVVLRARIRRCAPREVEVPEKYLE